MHIVFGALSLIVDIAIAVWVFFAVDGFLLSAVAAIGAFVIAAPITGFIAMAIGSLFSAE